MSTINPNDGSIEIALPRMTITRDWTRDQFFRSPLFSMSHPRGQETQSWSSYGFKRVTIGGEDFGGSVIFRGERLSTVYFFVIRSDFGAGWSTERQQAMMKLHDALLEADFGALGLDVECDRPDCSRRHCFPWGSVSSIYEGRSGDSLIEIEYAK